jgi:acyl-CoA thioesterase FadM
MIWRDSDRSTIATGMTKHACTDLTGHMIRIPKILLDALEKAAV